ncbi:MAG: Holliday junction resolvase RuvX, partial [Sediminibacterium sp.]|nr:Holliday junction resolvase RuvX [Sediminibacterium sp.]
MSRIISIDFGIKRTGIAVTNEMQTIAFPLETIPTQQVILFLQTYIAKENVSKIIIGYPVDISNKPTDATPFVEKFIHQLNNKFPHLPIQKVDEKYSSKNALKEMVTMGMRK